MTNTPSHDDKSSTSSDLEKLLNDYRVLIDNTPDLLYRTDIKGKIIFVSPSVSTLSGYSVDEAIGMQMADEVYLHPQERRRFLETLQKHGYVRNFQAQLKRKDGTVWWASTNAHFYKDDQGNILGVEGITRDVSDLKKAEDARRKSEELFRLAFLTSPDAIVLSRASDGKYIDINEGFSHILGYSRNQIIGKSALELSIWHNPEERTILLETLRRNGYVENMEAEFAGQDGSIKTGLISARILTLENEQLILSIIRDITERLQLEKQLHQAQKFEALGTLAGGIAHDFNNLLMVIQGRASLLGVALAPDDPLMEHVNGIEEYVRSATNLTSQILGFARGGKYETAPVDINELLRKCTDMFARTNKEITLHFEPTTIPFVAEVDRQQLEQVFLNIFVNARQAMSGGGDVFLRTSTATLSREFCRLQQLPKGAYGKISITDTGCGMDTETRQRAFDPFFTTKEKERGTGLGLASALGIIKNHDGAITLASEVGIGTTVDIYLPLSQQSPPREVLPENKHIKGEETILLVDDEQLVTEVGSAMLETLGYRVHIAENGQMALKFLQEEGQDIDLVILDLIMPEMDGEETFDKLREIEPQKPVLLSSGYSISGQASQILKKGCNGFLQKPFNIAELSQKIRDVLDS